MVCLVVAVCNLFTIVPNDLTYDRLVKEVLQKSAITVYVAAVFCSMKIPFINKKGFLWATPLFVTAIVNFPFTSLIFGSAKIDRADLIWIFTLSCLLTAFAEELFFRGILLDFLLKKFDKKFPILKTCLVSSAVFGLWHFTNLLYGAGFLITLGQAVYTFILGLMLSFTAIKTKNLFITALIHFVFNFGGKIIPVLGSGSVDLTFIILTALFGAVSIIYIFINYMKSEGKREGLFLKNRS